MSELIDELEQSFASAETQSGALTGNAMAEQTQVSEPVADEWMDAPKAYSKEYQESFKSLSPEWRKYLIDREKQAEKGFSDLGNKLGAYKWAETGYQSRAERLAKSGINSAKDYYEQLSNLDDAFAADPTSAIYALAQSYGVNLNNETAVSTLSKQVQEMKQAFDEQMAYLQQQRSQNVQAEVDAFINAKDEAGNLKNPHFEAVKDDMISLLNSGVAKTLDEAYNKAIWSNPDVRAKLLDEQIKSNIEAKKKQVISAKEAGFAPKSKVTADTPELSLRDELAKAFEEIE